jgi:hypothetical protein
MTRGVAHPVVKFPARVNVMGFVFTVERVNAPNESLFRWTGGDAIGSVDYETQEIRMREEELGPDAQRMTILHELIHPILKFTGLEDKFMKGHVEDFLNPFAIHLYDTIRRNPDLFLALMGPDE